MLLEAAYISTAHAALGVALSSPCDRKSARPPEAFPADSDGQKWHFTFGRSTQSRFLLCVVTEA
jgi:hypothetical protein